MNYFSKLRILRAFRQAFKLNDLSIIVKRLSYNERMQFVQYGFDDRKKIDQELASIYSSLVIAFGGEAVSGNFFSGSEAKKLYKLHLSNRADSIALECLGSDDEKIAYINDAKSKLTTSEKASIIKTISSDYKKIEFLKDNDAELSYSEKEEIIITLNHENQLLYVRNFTSDDEKIAYLNIANIGFNEEDKLFIIKSIKEDEKKLKCLTRIPIDYSSDKTNIIIDVQDDVLKLEYLIKNSLTFYESDMTRAILSIEDEEKRLACLLEVTRKKSYWEKTLNISSDNKITIIESIHNDELKLEYLAKNSFELSASRLERAILSIKEEDKRRTCLLEVLKIESSDESVGKLSSFQKIDIILSIKDEDKRRTCLLEVLKIESSDEKANKLSSYEKRNIILDIKDEDKRLTCLLEVLKRESSDESAKKLFSSHKRDIILSIKEEDKRLACLQEILKMETSDESAEKLSSNEKEDIILSIKEEDKRLACLQEILKMETSDESVEKLSSYNEFNIIKSFKEEDKRLTCLLEILKSEYYNKLSNNNKITIITSFKDEDKRLTCLLEILKAESSYEYYDKLPYNDKITIITSIKDEDNKLAYLREYSSVLESSDIRLFISSFKDIEKALTCFEEHSSELNIHDKAFFAEVLFPDDKKIDFLTEYSNSNEFSSEEKFLIIKSIKDDKKKLTYFERYITEFSPFAKASIIASIKDDKDKLTYFERYITEFSPYDKASIIESIQNDKDKLTYFERGISEFSDYAKESILRSIEDEEIKLTFLTKHINELFPDDKKIIIESIKDDKKKLDFLIKHINEFSSGDKKIFINSINDDKDKLDFLIKHINELSPDDKCIVIVSIKDEEKKLNCLKKVLENEASDESVEKLSIENITTIILSFEDDKKKLTYFERYITEFSPYEKAAIIKSIKDEEKKLNCLKKVLENEASDESVEKLSIENITTIILSFEDDKKKLTYFERYITKFSSYEKVSIIKSIKDEEKKFECLKRVLENEASDESVEKLSIENITTIILSFEDDKKKLIYFERYITEFSPYEKAAIIGSIENISELLLNVEISRDLLITMMSSDILPLVIVNFTGITPESSKIISDSLISMVDSIDTSHLVSNLLAMISIQATKDYEKDREDEPEKYLQIGMAANINSILNTDPINKFELETLKARLIETINSSYGLNPIESLLPQQNNGKELTVESILKALKITDKSIIEACKASIGDKINKILNPDEEKEETVKEKAEIILTEIKAAMREIVSNAFSQENAQEGGLLTRVCEYAFEIQKTIETKKRQEELKKEIKVELILTEKGIEKVYLARVYKIINDKFENENADEKATKKSNFERFFEEVFPNYKGKKGLKELYSLMKEKDEYKEELSSEITLEEKCAVQLTKENFKVNEEYQKQKLIISILKLLNFDKVPVQDKDKKLSETIRVRLEKIKFGIEARNKGKGESKGLELLFLSKLGMVDVETMTVLCLHYESILKKYTKSKNNNTKESSSNNIPATMTVGNIDEFLEFARKILKVPEYTKSILGEKVCDVLSKDVINEAVAHYEQRMAKRCYRTIPNISRTIQCDDKELRFRSYDVDDPEQLIAGARINTKASCFRIGGFQSETIKYITSSPHGTIIVVEDEHGNFLGRVYGFRVGNAVHFTRIYYNEQFDFGTVMEQIGQSIIDGSKEIEYVTAIPCICTGEKYTEGDIRIEDVDKNQEGKTMRTDHSSYGGVAIIARKIENTSESPKENNTEIRLNRDEPTEKFYKDRIKKVRRIDAEILTEEDIKEATKIINISIESSNSLREATKENISLSLINTEVQLASKIIIGVDWCILIQDNEIKTFKIKYNDDKQDEEVKKEIKEELKLLEETCEQVIIESDESINAKEEKGEEYETRNTQII